MFDDRSKHIEIIYHFIRDKVLKGAFKLQYIPTDKKLVEIFTKPMVKGKFIFLVFVAQIGISARVSTCGNHH
jgi:hypothetical protein